MGNWYAFPRGRKSTRWSTSSSWSSCIRADASRALSEPLLPSTVQKIGDLLAIAWSDGREDYLPLDALRRNCPCASCQGEPDVLGNPGPATLDPNAARTDLRSWQIVGGYGIQPRWGDGHSTGIYTFAFLRALADRLAP